jgi:SP family sugar:H+ symporter-like MFS transporter
MAKLPAHKFRGYKCVGPAVFAVDEKNQTRVSVDEVVWTNPHAVAGTTMNVE